MSSSVIPQYVSVSFHTGFRVLRTILVFSLLACKIKSREEPSCHIRKALQSSRHKNRGIKPWVTTKQDLAGSRQQVQFDVRIG